MIRIRRAEERGAANHGWLDTHYTFSFSDYYDPKHMGFRSLRVMNDDRVAAGAGFTMHSHRDMEIVTIVLEGSLEHKDSMGNGEVLRPGEVQRMSAGTGIRHSEFNPSGDEPVHLYQIWIEPDRAGHPPGYEQTRFDPAEMAGKLRVVASPDGREGSVTIHQDAMLFQATLDPGREIAYSLSPGRYAWLQLIRGSATLNGRGLEVGDGAAIEGELALHLRANHRSEFLLFDLA